MFRRSTYDGRHALRATATITFGSVATLDRLAALIALAWLAAGCGISRSQVKFLRDHEAPRIQFDAPISTIVKALNTIPSHCGPTRDHGVRRRMAGGISYLLSR
jgi:hypothetical protein